MRREVLFLSAAGLLAARDARADDVHELKKDLPIDVAFTGTAIGLVVESELAKGIYVTRTTVSCEGDAASMLKLVNMLENDPRLVALKPATHALVMSRPDKTPVHHERVLVAPRARARDRTLAERLRRRQMQRCRRDIRLALFPSADAAADLVLPLPVHHRERATVHCQRGLCSGCATLVADCLACKNRHEEQVRAMGLLLVQAKRVRSGYLRNTIFYGLVGIMFTTFGYSQLKWLGLQAVVYVTIGLALLYAAVANYLESRKYK